MKHFKSLFTALLLLCSVVAMAETVTIDGITYDVVAKAKQASVIAKETGKYSGEVVIPETIVYNDVTYSVTSIGQSAFNYCLGLTSVTIPNSVTSMGLSAFSRCIDLKEVHISDIAAWCNISFVSGDSNPLYFAKNLYLNGELVTELVIPNSVTSIEDYAFDNCSSLTSIEIPNSVASIGIGAFYNCSGLTSITIPNNVTRIESSVFGNCSGLTCVTIPSSVTSIGSWAFKGCSSLTSVTIGCGVKQIDSEAFAKCENLTDIYSLVTTVPSTSSNAFNESYPEYITLHVPAEAINSYKTKAPWSEFGTIVTIEEEQTPKCATPIISYSNGKLETECETEGAEFVISITSEDINNFYSNSVDLSVTYNISVYAMHDGYENSDTVNATLCWIENGDSNEDNTTNIISIPAVAVLVTSANGAVTVNCSLEGENVTVYTTDGTAIGTAVIANGSTTIQSGLSKGSVAVVKIGDKSVKVVVD